MIGINRTAFFRPHQTYIKIAVTTVGLLVVGLMYGVGAGAQSLPFTPATTENPKGGSYGMEGKISSPPPTQAGHITSPSGGQTYTSPQITVNGTCPSGTLVEVLNNGVLVGSTLCENGSFSLQIHLFPGQNELTVRVLDDLGQAGPASNTVIVTYNNAQFAAFGQSITLTSSYSRRAADPGSTLTWPIQLSGGTGPYAFSIDWGDGTAADLQSQSVAGIVQLRHLYATAGIYRVTTRVSDINGSSGYLQVIAVANGPASSAIKTNDEPIVNTVMKYRVLWIPTLFAAALLPMAFWLGGRYKMRAYRNKLAHDATMIHKLEL